MKFVEVTLKAVVRTLPKTLPVLKLAMCKLMSIPNTVASTPCKLQQCSVVRVLLTDQHVIRLGLLSKSLTALHCQPSYRTF